MAVAIMVEGDQEEAVEASTRIYPPLFLTYSNYHFLLYVGNQTSNLYLYTFLGSFTRYFLTTISDPSLPATLLLLLTISVAVVGRSIVIRRRARRMIEEAVQNGTWLPHAGRPAVKLGEKPKLFDVHTTADGIPYRSPLDRGLLAWDDLKVRPSSDQRTFA